MLEKLDPNLEQCNICHKNTERRYDNIPVCSDICEKITKEQIEYYKVEEYGTKEDNIFCGIDPGFSGGIVFINDKREIVFKTVMPIVKIKTGRKTISEYDGQEISKLLSKYSPILTGLEIQQSFPAQGIVSTFKIGRGFGLLEGILIALQLPYTLIKPRVWQNEMFKGLPKDDSKTLSILVAKRLYPKEDFKATPRCTKDHDGISDSCLISEYIRRINN